MSSRLAAVLSVLLMACATKVGAVGVREVSFNQGWEITPIQFSNQRPAAKILSLADPLSENGDKLSWQGAKIPSLRGFYENAPASVFPVDPSKNYWFGSLKQSTYNWAWYRKSFQSPSIPKGSRVIVKFTSVAWESRVWVNGRLAGQHRGSFTGFDLDITPYLISAQTNTIVVSALTDFGERPTRHVYGKMFTSGANMGGIIGPVFLLVRPEIYLQRTLIVPRLRSKELEVEHWIVNSSDETKDVQIQNTVHLPGGRLLESGDDINTKLEPGLNKIRSNTPATGVPYWSPERPELASLISSLKAEGKIIDSQESTFGLRDFSIADGKFFLNGERVRLYFGNTLTFGQFDLDLPNEQIRFREWLQRQKKVGVNVIRYHMAAVDSFKVLKICDEVGMLVINEWPWFHRVEWSIPEGVARNEFFRNNDAEMREWLYRDFNHPSCIIWSLANEVWTEGEIPLLEHTYQKMRELDWSGRPMITSSGFYSVVRSKLVSTDIIDFHNYSMHSDYPWSKTSESIDRDLAAIKELYGGVDRPIIISESLNIPRLQGPAMATAESYQKLAQQKWAREIGVNSLRNRGQAYGDLVSSFALRVLNEFRQDTRLQGFSPWFGDRNWLPDKIRNIYGPFYVGLKEAHPHFDKRSKNTLTLVAIKDGLEEVDTKIKVSLKGLDGTSFADQEIDLVLPADVDKTEQAAEISLGKISEKARGIIFLELLSSSGKILARNEYEVGLFPNVTVPFQVASNVRAAAYLPNDGDQIGCVIRDGTAGVTFIKDFADLSKFNVLILGDGWQTGQLPSLIVLTDWIKGGGRLFAFEGSGSGAIPGLSGFEVVRSRQTRQSFVDIASPQHPIFQGLDQSDFKAWNGNSSLISTSMISPLAEGALASAGSYAAEGQMATIVEASVGKGAVFVSQLDAVSRYNSDPAVRRFVDNVISYALSGNYKPAPAIMGSKKGAFMDEIAVIPENAFMRLDLRRVLNRPLARTLGQVSTFDFKNIPVGEVKFLGVPFGLVPSSDNGGKSVLVLQGNAMPDMPQRVDNISVQMAARELYFLHSAFYPSSSTLAHYVIRYKDGSIIDVPVNGNNVGDWFEPREVPEAFVAWADSKNEGGTPIGAYLYRWNNPYPDRVIDSISVVSEGSEQESGGSLILLGITARRTR